MAKRRFEFLEHPAEMIIRCYGDDLAELFINAALGMMQFIYGEVAVAEDGEDLISIEVIATDIDSLLVEWLTELLYLTSVNKRVYLHYRVLQLTPTSISALAKSYVAKAKDEIKAVTFHDLEVVNKNGYWQATIVFDV